MLKSKLITSLALTLTMVCTGSVLAQVSFTSDLTIEVGTNESLLLSTTGVENIDALNLTLVIGDGGSALGGSTVAPTVTDVVAQGVLSGGTQSFNPAFDPTAAPQVIVLGEFQIAGLTPVALDGSPVLELSFDTSSLNVGDTFDFSLTAGPGTNPTTFFAAGSEVETNVATFTVSVVSPFLLGDVNLDGNVDFLDIAPFIAILSTSGFQLEADINQDGVVDFLDISPFIGLLS